MQQFKDIIDRLGSLLVKSDKLLKEIKAINLKK